MPMPTTPIEALEISSRTLKFQMNAVIKCTEMFGFWDHPDQKAAASFEEMALRDKFYWVYKCMNPITRAEKGERVEDLLAVDSGIVGLPQGFDKDSTLTLGAAGDLFQTHGLEHSKDILFENISELLFDQGVSYANFESPITEQELQEEVISDQAAPLECCSRDQFDILKGYKDKRFTVLNTTNNHMFDMGVEGVETTQKVFSDEGIVDVGTNRQPDEFGKGKILVKDGIKLGFVAATYGLNGHVMPAEESHRINVANMLSKFSEPDLDILKRQIDDCKDQGCDFIIASLHWGYEFEFFPRRRQVEIAHTLIEWGADAILGHHPHVVQPIEYYRTRRDPNRVAVIAYSLGSLNWVFSAPYLALSAILNLTLAKGRLDGQGRTYIETARVTPVFRSSIDHDGKILTRIEKLADHLDGRSDSHSQDYIAELKRYADLALGETGHS